MPYSKLRHDSRNPVQWSVVVGVYIYSLVQLITGWFPGQVEENAESVAKYAWGIGLNLGAFAALVGMSYSVYYRFYKSGNETPKGLALEGGGLYFFSSANMLYALLLYGTGKTTSVLAAILFTSVAVGTFTRAVMINRGLRRIQREAQAHNERLESQITEES